MPTGSSLVLEAVGKRAVNKNETLRSIWNLTGYVAIQLETRWGEGGGDNHQCRSGLESFPFIPIFSSSARPFAFEGFARGRIRSGRERKTTKIE